MNLSNLAQALEASAKVYPRHTALLYGRKKVTYKELDGLSDNLAAGLIRLGLEKGQRVALLLFNRPEFVISYFGILKAGLAIVPINTMLKADEIKYMLQDAAVRGIVTSTSFLDMAIELRLGVDCLKHIILLSSQPVPDTVDFFNLIKEPAFATRIKDTAQDDTAVIMYTSGTTGHPKGAMLTHRNLISNASSSAKAIRISHRDNFVCFLPLFHSFAATVCMLLPIFCGAKITIFVSPRPFKRVLRAVIKKRVTVFTGVPSVFNILKDAKLPRLLTMPLVWRVVNPMRMCISGAAALPTETLVQFQKRFRIPLIEGYGLTEASPVVSLNPLMGVRKPGSIGLPLPDVNVKVVDAGDKELGCDEIGELLVKGPNVMKGYLNQPSANAETLKDGWLYTGDLVKIDKDGYIFIAGRKKEMVNVRGFNVYPKEIEDVLQQHPLVKEAAVIGILDQHRGEVPKGFVVLKENSGSPEAQRPRGPDEIERELLHYLRERLAAYKIPRRIEVVNSFPKTATGKILKRCLK
jgi:long-chain acyl-CoA synthetase